MTEIKQYKLILIGDAGVGKTSYVTSLLGDDFKISYSPTFGSELISVKFSNELSKEPIQYDILELGGQERYSFSRKDHFTGASCAIIMLSDNVHGLESLSFYQKELLDNCDDIPIIVVFNKSDLYKTSKTYYKFLRHNKEKNNSDFQSFIVSSMDKSSIFIPLYYLSLLLK